MSGLGKVARKAFIVLAAAGLAYALASQWSAAGRALERLSPLPVLASFGILLVAIASSMMAWRTLLADLGSPLGLRAAARIFFLGQLSKYVPGSVWSIVAQMELGRDYDLPRQRSGTATILLYPLNVVTSVVVALCALPFLDDVSIPFLWVAPLALLALAVLHPKVLDACLSPLLRLARRQPLERLPTAGGMLRAGCWTLLTTLLSGAHIWVLASALGAHGPHLGIVAIGAWATAWVIGFLLIIFPGGFGPRELVLVQLLRPVMPVAAAAVLVVASRLVFTLADMTMAGLGVVADRRGPRSGRTTPTPD